MRKWFNRKPLIVLGLSVLCLGRQSFGETLRIVDWNIEDDINGATTPLPGLNTVLQGIGNEIVNGDAARPIDIMSLEETTSNTTTVDPIVADLNGDYTGAKYETTDTTSDPNPLTNTFQASESGGSPTDGNGPNSIVWNANTVNLIAAYGVGTPLGSSNGEYRQVARYEFQPVGDTGSTGIFYVYVSHMKSGTGSTNATARGEEATIIRNDEATLPANSSVLYMGDLNSAPPEAEFTNFTATGQGQAFDPVSFSTSVQYWSESSTDLRYRDDYQLMTSNVLNDTGNLNYVTGTLHNFGNNGTTSSGGSVNSGSNTDLAYMTTANGYNPTQSQILSALTTASDHLPNVADYTVSVPEPASLGILSLSALLGLRRARRR